MATQKTYSFRPSPDLEAEIVEALAATNASVSDLLCRCVERSLHQVVRELHDERNRAATAYLKERVGTYKVKVK